MHEATNNRELLRPGITRFATNFIALQSIYTFKDQLLQMCLKQNWVENVENLRTRKDKDGAQNVRDLLFDRAYWISVGETIQICEPLIKVLRMVDSDDKAEMGFLYEAMDRAKEKIKRIVGSRNYKKWWRIIDKRWEKTLHRDIHAAGYFLNPRFQFSDKVQNDIEVMNGLRNVIQRMLHDDIVAQISAEREADKFRRRLGTFSTSKKIEAAKHCPPAEWWMLYGRDECPTLAPIAVRILSQTVSSSQCERNWTTFTLIHTKPRNGLKMDRLMNLVFCHYNMRLRERQLRRTHENGADELIDLDKIFHEDDPLQDWIREREDAVLDDRENSWLHEQTGNNDRNAANSDHGNSSDSSSGDGSNDARASVPSTYVETQNEGNEPNYEHYQGQYHADQESDESLRGRRTRDVNALCRGFNNYEGMFGTSTTDLSEGYSIPYTYDVQPGYNTSSSQETSSTWNPNEGHGYDNNPQFSSAVSSIIGSIEQYHPWYFNTEDSEVIQPARHSFWQ